NQIQSHPDALSDCSLICQLRRWAQADCCREWPFTGPGKTKRRLRSFPGLAGTGEDAGKDCPQSGCAQLCTMEIHPMKEVRNRKSFFLLCLMAESGNTLNSLQKFILILHDCLHSDFISLRIQGTSLIPERSQFDCIAFPIVEKSPVPICEDSNRLEDDAECFSVCTDGLCTSGLRPALCRLLRQVFLKDSQSSRCISCMVNMNGMVQLHRCAGLNPTQSSSV
ncbi:hypothetical protein, partial [Faecalibaculum rodentium]|uniref:hypothetical protein n=3 Tax=Faecalibaculum rodentium TaxID=1702221 RepID=UPI00272B3EE3